MHKIELLGMEFHAFHGVYDYEKMEGNTFWVDLSINHNVSSAAQNDNISETVDYGELYSLTEKVMSESVDLLETVAVKVLNEIQHRFPFVQSAEVSVSKKNPPIGGKCKKARVTIFRNFQ